MSEKNKKINCPECGAEIYVSESDNKMRSMAERFKIWLGIEEPENEVSENQTENENVLQKVSISPAEKSKSEKVKDMLSHRIANRVIVVIIALIMIVLMFTPFVKITAETSSGKDYEIKFSGVDGLKVFFLSYLWDEENVYDNDVFSENRDTNPSSTNWIKQEIILEAIDEKLGGENSVFVIASVLFIIYAILCVLLLVSSVKNLLRELVAIMKKQLPAKRYKSDIRLCTIFCLMPVVCYSLTQAFLVCVKKYFRGTSYFFSSALSWGAVISITVALLGVVFICAVNLILQLSRNSRYLGITRVRSIICTVLVTCGILAICLPGISVDLSDGEREKKLYASISEISAVTNNGLSSFDIPGSNDIENLIDETLPKGDASDSRGRLFVSEILLFAKSKVDAYETLEVLVWFVLIVTGFLLKTMINISFFGGEKFKTAVFLKILTFVLSVLSLTGMTVIKYAVALSLDLTKPYTVQINIGVGVTIMLISSLAALILRLKPKKIADLDAKEYENADTSYAPYIL